MNRTDNALRYFENLNCCQAVLAAFSDEIGMGESLCLKLGSGFGGGMNCGETCGAVTGAFMVLGLRLDDQQNDPDVKARAKKNILDFSRRFTQEQGSLLCKELLGVNISLEEGRQFAIENQLFETRCPRFVRTSVQILEEQLAGKKKGV